MNEPKYKPILFTAPMVMAILEGRKTQTRRLNGFDDVNKIPDAWDATRVTVGALNYKVKKSAKGKYGATFISHPGAIVNNTINICPQICPYGQPGDRLWVKENWRTVASFDNYSPMTIANKCMDAGYRKPWAPLQFEADGYRIENWENFSFPKDEPGKLRPSMFMPRWASRITLEVTGVRVERLQDISGKDAIAEGLKWITKDGAIYKYGIPDADGMPGTDDMGWPWTKWDASPVTAYKKLWEQIYGPGSWEKNPWVWVVEFKRVEDK